MTSPFTTIIYRGMHDSPEPEPENENYYVTFDCDGALVSIAISTGSLTHKGLLRHNGGDDVDADDIDYTSPAGQMVARFFAWQSQGCREDNGA